MKIAVPPAPIGVSPSPISQTESAAPKPLAAREKFGLIEAFDAGFIGRTLVSMLGVGAFAMLGVLSATQSPFLASSFFAGILLGVVLLKSQELFVKKVLGPRGANEKNLLSRVPLAVLLPLKYIVLAVLLGIAVDSGWLQPVVLAAGFIVGQIVIVAKVIGRFASLKMRAHQ